ncbi:MAG: Stp1/IreP family PP2C-type Ser/Thr phosphatase [Gammaproteobacteria bacterium]|jgi:protein phosphatase|nr:Stp1/IreP family PP2C-type Ser/Thr phosphatase [Gammaproteobacteria bacterium]MDP6616060.1 Stp1/IreP family PP2C-type Ser/Thr phosphatase [Gammaproteobacteria bacterium]MDP6695465.1 Stp1/IreP family PP2C-type Ser/Thr phosphatase [Gammaproteobacteria bacterium]
MPTSLKSKFYSVELSDTGKVRDHNEDAIGSNLDAGLYVLADGMGGYNAGEVASSIAVKTVIELATEACLREDRASLEADTGMMRQTIVLRDAISRANKIIHQTAQSQASCEGMGTTIVACLFYDNRMSIAHVGDSRLYRMRKNRLEQITMDHSLLQELVDRGFYSREEAERSTNRNYVTRALGVEAAVQVELQEIPVEPEDVFLLCSDGLQDMVDDEDIHLTISTFSANLETVGQQLIQLSNDHGGKDNVSVILARALEAFPAKVSLLSKLKKLLGMR